MLNFLAVLFKTVAWPSCHRPQQGSAIAISICNSFAASVASCKLAYRARNLANRRHRLRLLFYLRWTPYPISHIQTPYSISMSCCCICLAVFRFSACEGVVTQCASTFLDHCVGSCSSFQLLNPFLPVVAL